MRLSKKNIGQMLVMIFASVVCGLASNFIAEKPLPLFKALAKPDPVADAISFGEADADFVRQLSVDAGTVLIDARLPELFSLGHIPGAVNLPVSTFVAALPPHLSRLRSARLVIVYCGGPLCDDAVDLAGKLFEKRFKDILIYRGGLEDWQWRGNAIVR